MSQLFETVDPARLSLHPEFVRLFQPPEEDEVADLAARLGAGEPCRPLLIDAQGQVLAGVAHWRAALALGWSEISAVRAPLMNRSQARALMVAENVRTRELHEIHLARAMNNFFDMEPLRPPGGW